MKSIIIHLKQLMSNPDIREPNVIDYIFDRGWKTRLAPCINHWLLEQFREEKFRLKVLPFKSNGDFKKFEKLMRRYYWDNQQNQYKPLMQAISLLHEKYKVPYHRIWTERWFQGLRPDICAQLKDDRYIIVELGHFDWSKLFYIYEDTVAEFWHDGKSYFYCLSMKSKPTEHHTDHMVKWRSQHHCEYYCACSPYLDVFSLCQSAWKYHQS